jgi:hypothetical protein
VYQELRGVEKFVHGFLRCFFVFGKEKATSESVARTGASRRVRTKPKTQKSRRRRLAFVPRPRQVGNHRQM